MIEEARDAIAILDHRRRIVFLNMAAERLLSTDVAEACGQICRPARDGTASDPLEALGAFLAPPPEVVQGERVLCRRSCPAPPAWIDIEFIPFLGNGRLEGVLAILRTVDGFSPANETPLRPEIAQLAIDARQRFDFNHLPAQSPAGRRIVRQVRLASQTQGPVQLVGPRGAGKCWLGRLIHQTSVIRENPFFTVDCARLSPSALARALDHAARISSRNRGGVYLDRVECMSRDLQLMIIDWVDSGGPGKPRVIAGTDADLEAETAAGRLLPDFALAISVLIIGVPPLRERLEDLLSWFNVLARRLGRLASHQDLRWSEDARRLILKYDWPGNLDEIIEVVREWPVTITTEVTPSALPARIGQAARMSEITSPASAQPIDLDGVLAQVERRLITQALQKAHGNKSRAAELLGIWRARLLRRMEALGIAVGDEDGPSAPAGNETGHPEEPV